LITVEVPQIEGPEIVTIGSAGHEALASIGGKAANLGELVRAGFRAPCGFIVTTRAYAEAVHAAKIDPLVDDLARTPITDTPRLASLAAEIRAAITAAPLNGHLAAAIVEAYQALGDDLAVAVRSSATAEDLASASFAGQQDTFLNVRGSGALAGAVRSCWASLWTDRAVIYRAAASIDQREVRIAVVVQKMIHAVAAGVLFTANPLTGRRRQAVIEVSPGLGEAVVSGIVNPDQFVVDTLSGAIVSQRHGEGAKLPGGASLTREQVRELVQIGDRVEAHFGAPQDIEFAFETDGQVELLQSRPITTLYPLPEGATADDLRVYMSATADEGVVRPITPMGLQAFRVLTGAWADYFFGAKPSDRTAGPAAFVEAGMRMYYDVTPIVRSALARRLGRSFMSLFDAHTAALLRALDADPRLAPRGGALTVLRLIVLPFLRTRIVFHLVAAMLNPTRVRRKNRAAMDAILAKSEAPVSDTPIGLLDRAEALLWNGGRALPVAALFEPIAGAVAQGLAEFFLRGRATPDELQLAMTGLPGSVTVAMTLDLWNLALAIRGNREIAKLVLETAPEVLANAYLQRTLPSPIQDRMSRYLERHGHRAVAEIDLGLPRWSEDPAFLFGALANYLRRPAGSFTPDVARKRAVDNGEAMAAELAKRGGALRRAAVGWLLGRARNLLGLREQWKDDLTKLWARSRTLLLPVGAALVAAGRLEAADDIFFVMLPEARTALGSAGPNLQALVHARRQTYAAELRRRHIPAMLLSDGTEPQADAEVPVAGDGLALNGIPASPGKVRGLARVLRDPSGARLEPGEVLVAPSTDPGWTPLFMTAGGLVMEKGGAMSHGAVIAREYAIPAVAGVAGALQRIQTGDTIEVDGTAGRVTRIIERAEGS
jgi:pyruvate,water dikinase